MRKPPIAAAFAAACASATAAAAQTFPTRPVTIVVPFAAGGPSDVLARVLGERMRTTLNQMVDKRWPMIKAVGVKPQG